MKIAVLKETATAERRVAATPETVKKFVSLGANVAVEAGAGDGADVRDAAYAEAGAVIEPREALVADADLVLAVQVPDMLPGVRHGAAIAAICNPYANPERIAAMAAAGLTVLAMDWMPRITRAQSMDVLSSQSNLAGYKAVLDAAAEYGRAFPMMMTAAGTIPAARVFILGVGVAGLQAIERPGVSARSCRQRMCALRPRSRSCRSAPSPSLSRTRKPALPRRPVAMRKK